MSIGKIFEISSEIVFSNFNPILPGGGAKYTPLLFFLHHPKTAQGMNLKLSDFKDTLLRHFLKVKPVRYILSCCHGNKITNGTSQNLAPKKSEKSVICKDIYKAFWYPQLLPRGEVAPPPPQLSKKQLPHEPEILQDTFESLRNVKVVYIVFTWLPKQSLKGEVFGGKIARFQSKIPIIQIATKLTIFKITV